MSRPTLEAPSGKWSKDENFPVASRLIAPRLRSHVVRFYGFARTIDDIADSPDLAPEEKLTRLTAFEQALVNVGTNDPALIKATALRQSLEITGIPVDHAQDLIVAFKQDAVKQRYDDWDDLMIYCRYSAEPVGRFLLDLHGEDRSLWPFSDALCTALQVINHLQDCADDYRKLDRVYLPQDWFDREGESVTALDQPQSSPHLRRVFDRCLTGVTMLLRPAAELPLRLKDRRLALESAAILSLAQALTERLYRRDPLAKGVTLSKSAKAVIAAGGTLGTALHRWRGPKRLPGDTMANHPQTRSPQTQSEATATPTEAPT